MCISGGLVCISGGLVCISGGLVCISGGLVCVVRGVPCEMLQVSRYGVTTISRLLTITSLLQNIVSFIGLFCKRTA